MKFRLNGFTVQLYVNMLKMCCHKELFQFHTVHVHTGNENLQVLMT